MTHDMPDWYSGFALIPKTSLRPSQIPYFATVSVTVPGKSTVSFYIADGYAPDLAYVPLGSRFSIWHICFSSVQNSLAFTEIMVEKKDEPGVYTALATQYGYGKTEYPAGIYFDFDTDTRPIYRVTNYAGNTITVAMTIFGVEERMV